MENPGETMCRLCLVSATHENCEVIDNQARGILGILLSKWNLDEGKHLICNGCSTKLFAAFDFKRTCVNTEDCISFHVNSEEEDLLDLREIYVKENDTKLSISEIQNVCRLCMQLIFGEFKHFEQLDSNMRETYIPEINFSSTKNPVVCEACYEAFKSHSSFLTVCLENEKKIKYVNDEVSDLQTEKVAIKTEEVYVKIEEVYIKTEETDKSYLEETADVTNVDDERIFETDTKQQPQSLVQRDPFLVQMYECDECNYKTRVKGNLRLHKVQHRDPAEIQMFKCDECSFKTKYKKSLRTHKLTHKDPSTIEMFKCDKCSFQTRRKSDLYRHELVHKDASEIQMYECDECSYKTRYKKDLRTHKLNHRDPSEIQMYECDECSYKTRVKGNLRKHMLKHKDPSEVQMYECDECSYTTIDKSNLRAHKVTHRDPSERQTYMCEKCARQFKYKVGLRNHMLKGCVDGNVAQHTYDANNFGMLHCFSQS